VFEGVANFLVTNGSIPESLRNIRFVTLEIGRLIAGAQYRGQLEERLTGIIAEVRMLRHVVLVIDEIHAVVGVGGGDGALNVGNLLKPPLSRGEFRCIGTTSFKDYSIIEKDSAFARRFQKIVIEEPSLRNS
jgi:ATP-dependent Clp protease ATP-binding subunit ClpA